MARFTRVLLAIAVVALGVRVGYVLLEKGDDEFFGDQLYYQAQANTIARGGGFTEASDGSETAEHPPLTALALAPTSWISDQIGGRAPNELAQRLTMAVFGTGAVVLIALLGRSIAGARAGLIAGTIAALYPNFWMNDGVIMSETLATMAVALAILLAYRLLRYPSWPNAAWLAIVCGLAMLVRAELGLLLPVMVLPLVFRLAGRTFRERARLAGLVLVVSGVVVAPWVISNLVRFEEPVLFSTNDGLTLCGANHKNAYNGDGAGLWAFDCAFLKMPKGDRSVVSNHLRDVGLDYARDHAGRVPVVVAARIGRVWSVYAPGYMAKYNVFEGREPFVSLLGFGAFWLLMPWAASGAWMLRRRSVALWPLLAQAVMVTITAALVYGLVRFRVPAEVSLVVLAAVAIDERLVRRSRPIQHAGVTVRS